MSIFIDKQLIDPGQELPLYMLGLLLLQVSVRLLIVWRDTAWE